VTIDSLRCGARCTRGAGIEDLEGEIVGNSTNQRRVKRMMLDIVYNRCMVGIYSSGMKGFIVRGEFGGIPVSLVRSTIMKRG